MIVLKDVWMLDINSGMWKEVRRDFISYLASGVMIRFDSSACFEHTKANTFNDYTCPALLINVQHNQAYALLMSISSQLAPPTCALFTFTL